MFSDINLSQIIFRKTPPKWHPYIKLARLDRPIGIWLLLFPCLWSIILANEGFLPLPVGTLLLFILGAVMMRSAGCIINDLWDKDLDANVARTKERPLASGEISVAQALRFLVALLALSLVVLALLPHLAVILGVLSVGLVVAYPYMKRLTWAPQLFLGLTFNWGALMGWAAMTERLSFASLLLYIGGIFWTLAYDTIYAHQDIKDDTVIGIKSTARLFGEKSKFYVGIFYTLSFFFLISARLWAYDLNLLTPLLSSLSLGYALWSVKSWDKDDPVSCLKTFRGSQWYGWLVLFMLSN